MSKLRVELWNNAHSMPAKDHDGTGQERRWIRTRPTRWYAMFHHPILGEGFCLKEYYSPEERKRDVTAIKKEATAADF